MHHIPNFFEIRITLVRYETNLIHSSLHSYEFTVSYTNRKLHQWIYRICLSGCQGAVMFRLGSHSVLQQMEMVCDITLIEYFISNNCARHTETLDSSSTVDTVEIEETTADCRAKTLQLTIRRYRTQVTPN